MPAKQITDLSPADSFDEGDLLFIRKTGLGTDKNINYANFVRSIASNFIDGYVIDKKEPEENKIILNHASGMILNKYYDGMKISFIAPITSTGTVNVKIASLEFVELQNLITKDSTEIKQGDYVEAIYSVNEEGQGAFYRTNNYATNPKPAVVPEELPHNQVQPEPVPVPTPAVPESQDMIVTVGPNGRFKTIKLAIRALTAEYGDNGSNIPCIIMLQDDYIIDEITNLSNVNLSWITIISKAFIQINMIKGHGHQPVFQFKNATAPIIAASFSVQKMGYFADGEHYIFNFRGAKFNLASSTAISGGAMVYGRNSEINIDSSTFDLNGDANYFISDGANNNIYNFSNSQFNNIEGTFFYNGFQTNDKTLLNIDNCQIKSISTTNRVIEATGTGAVNIANTTITGASAQLTYFNVKLPVILKNCSITSSVPSAQSVVVHAYHAPCQITIDGGNYQTIVANYNTTIRLFNSPTIASRSTASNGKIIQG